MEKFKLIDENIEAKKRFDAIVNERMKAYEAEKEKLDRMIDHHQIRNWEFADAKELDKLQDEIDKQEIIVKRRENDKKNMQLKPYRAPYTMTELEEAYNDEFFPKLKAIPDKKYKKYLELIDQSEKIKEEMQADFDEINNESSRVRRNSPGVNLKKISFEDYPKVKIN
ncbi:hypothetical protein BK126_28525 [Paenibacillus sp. FSL H7-0326]|uniref:hypothetical protein n=1 Tax=Paenibacillus sp. FSL H7-0326 TaxID=1921144 RepID=UPI00096C14FD|nr:hypothetical protein [Paenibacillus sp. FSL H7-0326]OMC62645.1 hypothetical protein BK126_28525 [Paenibacillus sp. FSL H7-0326]